MDLHTTTPAVVVRGLEKSYGNVHAVNGIDLEIYTGEIFAILGPNGAGKTTTVEILEGYRARDRGDVRVLGLDPGSDRKALSNEIGIVLQSTGVDRFLTVAETVDMYSGYYLRSRDTDELLELVGLTEKRDARIRTLSGGQQRRLDVAVGLAGDPRLVFLDEPTTGFDPSARRGAWEMVRNLAAIGKTVVLTTHYMDEAQYLADRVAVIAAGRIVAEGAPASLGGRDAVHPRLVLTLADSQASPVEIGWSTGDDGRFELVCEELSDSLGALVAWAQRRAVPLDSLEIVRPSLEDVYLALTGAADAPVTLAPLASPRRRRRT